MTPREAFALYSADPMLDTQVHLQFLRESACGNVLEIGVHTGISTAALLLGVEEKGGHVWSVDVSGQSRYAWYGHPQWTFLLGDSGNILGRFAALLPTTFDLVYIDGGHSYEQAISDLANFSPLVRSGGLILLHDVLFTEFFPGIARAFKEWRKRPEYDSEIREGSCGMGVLRVK